MSLKIALFSNGAGLIDRAIRKFSPGYEHAGILQDDGQLWETLPMGGVRLSPSINTEHEAPELVTLLDPQLTAEQESKVLAFLASVAGSPYDVLGVLAIPLWSDWDAPGSYFCSELVATALQAAHAIPLNCPAYDVWPCHLGWLAGTVWPIIAFKQESAGIT